MARRLTNAERDYLTRLVDHFGPRLEGWLQAVAEGRAPKIDKKTGQLLDKGSAPQPAEALRLFTGLLEFTRPKLSRAEMSVEVPAQSREELVAQARRLGIPESVLFGTRGEDHTQH